MYCYSFFLILGHKPCLCLPRYFRYILKPLLYSKCTYMYVYIGNVFLSGIHFCEEGGFLFLNKSLIKCYIIGQSFLCMWIQCKHVQFSCCLYSKFASMCEFLQRSVQVHFCNVHCFKIKYATWSDTKYATWSDTFATFTILVHGMLWGSGMSSWHIMIIRKDAYFTYIMKYIFMYNIILNF